MGWEAHRKAGARLSCCAAALSATTVTTSTSRPNLRPSLRASMWREVVRRSRIEQSRHFGRVISLAIWANTTLERASHPWHQGSGPLIEHAVPRYL